MRKEEGKYGTKETRKKKARKEKRNMLKGMMKALKYGIDVYKRQIIELSEHYHTTNVKRLCTLVRRLHK